MLTQAAFSGIFASNVLAILPAVQQREFVLKKIISGGQTGADQGALDGAIFCEFPYGGSIPAGRKTENGMLSEVYRMQELDSGRYSDRTERNVIDADSTLILSHGPLTGGSALTEKIARHLNKPCLHIDFHEYDLDRAVQTVAAWLINENIETLNVAGPRASSDRHIYALSRELVTLLIQWTQR